MPTLRELLAIVFACQWFSTYLLGRSFVAESDHKPLEMIAMRNLANVPPHLQRMLLELQRYDVTIKYQPGAQMQLADQLAASTKTCAMFSVEILGLQRQTIYG